MNAPLHDLREQTHVNSAFARRMREICGDDDQAFLDALEGETDTLEAFRRVVRWTAEQQALAAAMKDLAETYTARSKVLASRAEQGKLAMFHGMTDLDEKTLRLPEATLSIANGKPRVVGDGDVDELPYHLVRIKREPDKTAIAAALEAGEEVPGFTLSNAEPHLTMRIK